MQKSVWLWVRKGRSLRLKSLPLNLMDLSGCERWEMEGRCSHTYMSLYIYAPNLSAECKSDKTSKLHPTSSESKQQHSCGISIYTAAGVWRSFTRKAGLWIIICLLYSLLFPQLFSIVDTLQCHHQYSTMRLRTSHPVPAKKCPTSEDVFHIRLIA